ncbi:phosphoglycerate dehydrogenase [Microbacterium pseudoresistens]|uniref:Phosphoglycerate dehydrogenase-like enzyme n=1 Tax=Microbacterium pseudoresistens TaxID=640634 RepID=A0A7Y9JM47_9MICO|nr:phosphoglycerate dehydrogenase [Microbacterium pseudoresistens]NYD53138.1 phosphoglycerate dehydrogenase-like enzyme [Microbacterium pseudoresistens]
MKVLLPSTLAFDITPIEGVEFIEYDVDAAVPAEHHDAEVLVTWANPTGPLEQAAAALTRLRWIQTLSAGSDQVLAAGFTPNAVITSGRSLHDLTVSEHALALTLAAARSLHTTTRAQIGHRWAGELGGAQPIHDPDRFTTLRGAHVLIWGFGSIAHTLAPHLTALGAHVTGVARSAGERGGYPVIAESDVDDALPGTDVLIMILPGTPETAGILTAERIALLPRRAWVVNVGRGTTIDEPALADALRRGSLGGAALDVTSVEPLPASSELWDLPRAIITPHAAGGRPIGADDLIADNLRALLEGRALTNVVAR